MLKTRTGGFPIGFRRGWSEWQKDLPALLEWAKQNRLPVIDLGRDADQVAAQVREAGLIVGSADLPQWQGLLSPDAGKRADAVAQNIDFIKKCVPHGIRNFFIVMLPEDQSRPRKENFGFMMAALAELTPQMDAVGARLVIEGWPGPGALCCTPEGYRAAIRESGSKAVGINYDPSHLLRMGIDPIRFVDEFAPHVYHVHGKDTEILHEAVYEYGTEQIATFAQAHGFGSHHWRYTIPGHGCTRWTRAFEILRDAGYDGAVSIELEDEHFNGSEEGEKAGILAGSAFLASC